MIEKHVRIANELGRKVANADEAREILKIGTWYNSTEETRLKLGLPPNREGQTRSKEREVAQSMFSIRGSSILPKAVLFVIGVATNRHAQQPAQIGDELLVLGSDKTCSGVAIQDQDKTKQTTTNKTGDQKPSNPKTETSDDSPDTPDHAAQPKVFEHLFAIHNEVTSSRIQT